MGELLWVGVLTQWNFLKKIEQCIFAQNIITPSNKSFRVLWIATFKKTFDLFVHEDYEGNEYVHIRIYLVFVEI